MIRISPIRLIGADGEQVGVVETAEAMRLADEAGLDLVEVVPDSRPPVCRSGICTVVSAAGVSKRPHAARRTMPRPNRTISVSAVAMAASRRQHCKNRGQYTVFRA